MSAERVAELVELLRQNRFRHRKRWRKVRRDRVAKLFPDLSSLVVEAIIEAAIARGEVEACEIEADGELLPAIKLTFFPVSG